MCSLFLLFVKKMMSVELIDEKKEDEPLSEMHVVVHEKKAKLVKAPNCEGIDPLNRFT